MAPLAAARLDAALRPYAAAFPAARWQRPDAFHVTLRFLGPTPPDQVEVLVDRMRSCADAGRPFPMASGRGDGIVRSSGGVAWLRIGLGDDAVADLARCLAAQPLAPDVRSSAARPHLTVARRADASLIAALAGATLGEPAVEWMADRMVLYRSHTGTPAGSSYESLADVPLGRPVGSAT